MRSVAEYLRHIVTATDKIAAYIEGMDSTTFLADNKTQDAVIRQVEIIGEAGKNVLTLSPDFEGEHPEVAKEFFAARSMRNTLAHGYFDVDMQVVWNTASVDVVKLKAALLVLLKNWV